VPAPPLVRTAFPDMPLHRRGKVRDVYDLGEHLLIVATDRISAFDCVLEPGIPDKGRILTQLSAFWFDLLHDVVPNHVVSLDPAEYPEPARRYDTLLRGRSMLVRRTSPLPVECVARGYLSGSGWRDYQRTGEVCGVRLPAGLVQSDRLPAPIFTPATKADEGHDENITEARARAIVGPLTLDAVRSLTLEIYRRAAAHAERCGLILADTKLEFGIERAPAGDRLLWIDEALTPDSSRFWQASDWVPGGSPPSFDKQFVRDHLERVRWNKQPPAPVLPADIVERTREKYVEAFKRLTGRDLD
jgi:phosphoribosylaminoimidazole-succinocarboxamide synthase